MPQVLDENSSGTLSYMELIDGMRKVPHMPNTQILVSGYMLAAHPSFRVVRLGCKVFFNAILLLHKNCAVPW